MTVFVVSDGTGDTGSAAVRAAMVQFRERWRLRVFRDTRTQGDVRRVVEQAEEVGALVVFSMVEGEIVEFLHREAEARRVVVVDLLGPLIMRVAQKLKVEPKHQPGLLHGFSDDYFDRVDAVEFAVRHCPGHSPGHVVFLNEALKFGQVGDVLFQGSIGRTDFEYGDHDALIDAIKTKLLPLPDDFTFICGHGPASTIGAERAGNPFLK